MPEQPPVVEPQPELPPAEQPDLELPPVVEPEPQPEQPPVVEQPQLELPPVVIPPAEQPKPTKPLFYQQKNITSDLANLTLTDLLEKSQQSSRIHNLQLARVLYDEGENVWVNATRLDTKGKETPWVSGYERTDEQLQIGAKHTVNNSTGRATFGAAYTRNNSDSSYRGQNYTADGKLDLGSVFFKQQFDDQTYVTFDGGYGKDKTTIKAMGQQSDVKRDVATAGFNVGKTYSSVIDIEPSIGVRYDRLDGADYSIAGASVQAPSLDLISYRAGVNLSKTMVLASGATVQPSLSSNYVKASDKTSYLRFNDVGFAQSYGDYHYHDAGVKVGMGNFGIALKGTYAKGEDIQEQKGGTLQLSYKW